MAEVYGNAAAGTLSAGINNSVTTLILDSGQGALFPATGTFRILIDTELLKVTARSTDTLTVVRGQEGTAAASHSTGANIYLVLTAAAVGALPSVMGNVRTSGAVGDGSTDDTAAFTAALAGGGSVFVPPGDYVVENLALTVAGTRLFSYGGATIRKKTSGGASIVTMKIQAADVMIEGLIVDVDSYTNGQAVLIESAGDRAIIRNNRVLDAPLGVYLNSGAVDDVMIDGNLFNGAGYGVLTHDNFTGARLAVRNNTFIGGNAGDGISINTPGNPVSRPSAGATDVDIVGNVVSGYTSASANEGLGIALAHVQGGTVAGNTVRGCENDGIHIEDGSRGITVTGNRVLDCDRGGIVVTAVASTKEDCWMINITGNTVENCAIGVTGTGGISVETGVSAVGNSGVNIIGNVVDDCGDAALATCYGIYLHSGTKNARILGNTIRNTRGIACAGIRLGAVTNVDVAHNRCFDDQGTKTQIYGLTVTGNQSDVTIFGNDLDGNLTAAYDESGIGTKTRYYGLWDDGHVPGFLAGQLALVRTGTLLGQLHVQSATTGRPVAALQQPASGSAAFLELYNAAATLLAYIDSSGNAGIPTVYNPTNFNNSLSRMHANGVQLERNIADANPAVKASQVHASSTGDIQQWANSAGIRARVTQAGKLQAEQGFAIGASSTAGQFARANGTDGTTILEAIAFARGGTVLNPVSGTTVMVWRAPFACTVTNVRSHFKGGTSIVVNARRNQASNHLSSNHTNSTADAWGDGGTVQNTAYVAGDDLEIMIVTVSGAVTEAAIQVDFTRP